MTALIDTLRADLLAGRVVRVLDVARDRRPEAIAALAELRDELPVRVTWRTVSESHVCVANTKPLRWLMKPCASCSISRRGSSSQIPSLYDG